jgi:GDP-L-fucose synthase
MEKEAKIYVAGHRGLVGSAILRRLKQEGYDNLVFRRREELDLRNGAAVAQFFAQEQPDYVFLAAARVGGIWANAAYPAAFMYDNLVIHTNVIHQAYGNQVEKLLFLGSSCIYPRLCSQPIKEEYLLQGPLEPTNESYAVAKIAGIKMCQAYNRQYGTHFISAMPSNLYGPGDNFDLLNSHVLGALIRKCHEAKVTGADQVIVWGTGTPRREFLYIDDLAEACLFLMKSYESGEIINVGMGQDLTIRELAYMVAEIVGFRGQLIFDPTKPDGMPQKLLDVTRLTNLGWQAQVPLEQGIGLTYSWFLDSDWAKNLAVGGRHLA